MKRLVPSTAQQMPRPGTASDHDAQATGHLRALNLFGLDHLEPVLLAARADEQPLLLIGAHGTAKSALLNRIAAALDGNLLRATAMKFAPPTD